MTSGDSMVRLDAVTKRYGSRNAATTALDAVTVSFARGSFTAVMGPSGAGKSTLLHCAAGLDRPTAGRVWLDGTDLTGLPERALARLRRERIGFVFHRSTCCPESRSAPSSRSPPCCRSTAHSAHRACLPGHPGST